MVRTSQMAAAARFEGMLNANTDTAATLNPKPYTTTPFAKLNVMVACLRLRFMLSPSTTSVDSLLERLPSMTSYFRMKYSKPPGPCSGAAAFLR